MSGKKEVIHNFKSCDDFAMWLNAAVANLDCSKSDVIRTCIMIGLPAVCSNPSLIDHVRFEDIRRGGECK